AVGAMLAREEAAGMKRLEYYSPFQKQAERVKNGIVAFLIDAKQKGLRVGAYGAAAKGNTLMNFAGIRPDLVPYVVDRAAAKQGRFMPGSRIPIVEEAHLWADKPDVVLILPWNIRAEVMEQLAGIRAWGGKFVVAVPKLEVT
ncbi:MAG: SAM-dependent methyltransferase, partial [Methylobacterium sp.]|nr:SAM-dependent methyltransferase [Methylobacterium sp.]